MNIWPNDPMKREVDHNTSMGEMSFWEHLDVLRGYLVKIALVTVLCGIVAFLFNEEVFSVILAPKSDTFITYRLFSQLAEWTTGSSHSPFSVQLINTGWAEQFVIHMKTSMYVGFLLASPYAMYLMFRFISPALYEHEKKYSLRVVGSGYAMFMFGVLLCYVLIFPLTVRFLGIYQVSSEVANLITLQSYMGTLLLMSVLMGVVFELPVLCWLLAKLGLLSAGFMRRFRKHSVIVILLLSAIIIPTSDVFTLSLVALPIWLLYEFSIWLVHQSAKQ